MNRLIIAATGLSMLTPLFAQGAITSPAGGLPPKELPRRKMAYAYPSTAATALTVTTSAYAQPFVQYLTK